MRIITSFSRKMVRPVKKQDDQKVQKVEGITTTQKLKRSFVLNEQFVAKKKVPPDLNKD